MSRLRPYKGSLVIYAACRLLLTLTILSPLVAGCSEPQLADQGGGTTYEPPQVANQDADITYNPPIENPAYLQGNGPIVAIDEAHFNFHTMEGRYKPFAELLRRDGYLVRPFRSEFNRKNLEGIDILVVANALAQRNQQDWSLPTPSAFSDEEIEAVRRWVLRGGSLLLIVDHMPFPGAAEKLAGAFGIHGNNGFALNEKVEDPTIVFRRSEGSLADHPITNGRTAAERVDSVASFTGSAFRVDEDKNAQPLLILGADVVSIMPTVAWEFTPETPRVPAAGWNQGAVFRFGEGRVAVFGEAALFSAQVAGPERSPLGMNAPVAAENFQFVLNVSHWLSGLLDPDTNWLSRLLDAISRLLDPYRNTTSGP